MTATLNPALQDAVQKMVRQLSERRVRIAVVGDMILDNAIEGVPTPLHPEFKIPLLRDVTTIESIGGAANIALALSRLGVEVTVFGIVGSDLPGRQLENLIDRQGFISHMITEKGWLTPKKDWIYHRLDGQVKLVQRIDYDRPLPARAREELVGEFRAHCPEQIDVVILVDHGLGCIGPESIPLVSLAKEHAARVVAIPRSRVLHGHPLDAIVLNSTEMRALAEGEMKADVKGMAARYAREYQRHIFLTLFEEGMDIFPAGPEGGQVIHLDMPPLPQYDWMGVRDITTAVAALGLALNTPLDTIGQIAMLFRFLVAGVRGSGRVFWRDIGPLVGGSESLEVKMA